MCFGCLHDRTLYAYCCDTYVCLPVCHSVVSCLSVTYKRAIFAPLETASIPATHPERTVSDVYNWYTITPRIENRAA